MDFHKWPTYRKQIILYYVDQKTLAATPFSRNIYGGNTSL